MISDLRSCDLVIRHCISKVVVELLIYGHACVLGWRPRRSIIFCSWDGEEYGIIGSIEWLEVRHVILMIHLWSLQLLCLRL